MVRLAAHCHRSRRDGNDRRSREGSSRRLARLRNAEAHLPGPRDRTPPHRGVENPSPNSARNRRTSRAREIIAIERATVRYRDTPPSAHTRAARGTQSTSHTPDNAPCGPKCGPKTKSAAGPKATGTPQVISFPPPTKSGRPGSNRRRPAWEAGILPLNYARQTWLKPDQMCPVPDALSTSP